MIIHGRMDGFLVEMNENELKAFLRWWTNADMDNDDPKEN